MWPRSSWQAGWCSACLMEKNSLTWGRCKLTSSLLLSSPSLLLPLSLSSCLSPVLSLLRCLSLSLLLLLPSFFFFHLFYQHHLVRSSSFSSSAFLPFFPLRLYIKKPTSRNGWGGGVPPGGFRFPSSPLFPTTIPFFLSSFFHHHRQLQPRPSFSFLLRHTLSSFLIH